MNSSAWAISAAPYFLVGGFGVAPADILLDSFREQLALLKNKAYFMAEVVQLIILDVYAVNEHFALDCVIETRNQAYKGGLAAAGRAEYRYGLALVHFEIQRFRSELRDI